MAQKKPRAGTKLLLATSFAIALIVGIITWRQNLDTDPQIVTLLPHKAPNPNGFDVYVKAARMIVPANPAVDEVDDGRPPTDPKVRAQKYSLANKEAWLRRNAAGFALMQAALKMECRFPAMRGSSIFPPYAPLRELARCKTIERKTREMRGDWNGAVQSQIDTIQMGNDIAHGGVLISALVGIAVEAIGRGANWNGTEHLNAQQTRAAIARLQAIYGARFTYSESMQEEKWYSVSQLLNAMHKGSWRQQFINPNYLLLSARIQLFASSKRRVMDNLIQMFDAQIANAQQPYTLPQKPLPEGDTITQILAPIYDKTRAAFARGDAGNALWLTALALRAYKLEHNAYPTKLQELVPNYLKQVPADPFGGGEALRYKRAGNSYVLWSIGPDGIDDGGTPIQSSQGPLAGQAPRLPQIGLDSKGDYVAGKNR